MILAESISQANAVPKTLSAPPAQLVSRRENRSKRHAEHLYRRTLETPQPLSYDIYDAERWKFPISDSQD
jgi:hypothetical protein